MYESFTDGGILDPCEMPDDPQSEEGAADQQSRMEPDDDRDGGE